MSNPGIVEQGIFQEEKLEVILILNVELKKK